MLLVCLSVCPCRLSPVVWCKVPGGESPPSAQRLLGNNCLSPARPVEDKRSVPFPGLPFGALQGPLFSAFVMMHLGACDNPNAVTQLACCTEASAHGYRRDLRDRAFRWFLTSLLLSFETVSTFEVCEEWGRS